MNAQTRLSVLGGFSFEGEDSLPDFSEFDSTSVVLEYQAETVRRPSESRMAPTTTIETITITRPLKVIAFICGVIVVVLMVMALASTDWLMTMGWRQGLFMHCVSESAPTPLPFNLLDPPGCHKVRDEAYIHTTAGLCVVTLITDIVATVLTFLGLRSKDHRTKYKYYRLAVGTMVLALFTVLIALVIYPVCFTKELNEGVAAGWYDIERDDNDTIIDGWPGLERGEDGNYLPGNRQLWEFGWAYGVGWGAAIFLFGGVILLLCDKESEEIYYKERKIVHDTDSRA